MDIGIFGALILLLIIGWLPVVILLTLICLVALPITYLINQSRTPKFILLSKFFMIAAILFAPCQIYFLRFILYGLSSRDFSWWVAIFYSVIGILFFILISRVTQKLSTTNRNI
jgi:asparagine N-glycosylation enzyme membrane subunit Stt3